MGGRARGTRSKVRSRSRSAEGSLLGPEKRCVVRGGSESVRENVLAFPGTSGVACSGLGPASRLGRGVYFRRSGGVAGARREEGPWTWGGATPGGGGTCKESVAVLAPFLRGLTKGRNWVF